MSDPFDGDYEFDDSFAEDSGGNKIGCPTCGLELFDKENWEKNGYYCKGCGYTGHGV